MTRRKRVSWMASLGWGLWMAGACGGGDAPTELDPPVTQEGAVHLVAGDVALLSTSACNTRGAADGVLVCAVVVGTPTGARGLWLLDMDAAAQGPTPVPCDGSDLRCHPITSTWSGRATGQGFAGDTLLYQDATGAWALRPGETSPVLLVPGVVDHCLVDSLGRAAACFGATRTKGNDRISDLFAGALPATGEGGGAAVPSQMGALSLIDTTPVAVLGTGAVQQLYPPQLALSPDGAKVVWSAVDATTPNAGQALRWLSLPLQMPLAPVQVSAHVDSWQISADGSAWSWLEVSDANATTGRLMAAAFPDGASSVLSENVGAAAPFGARGLGVFSQSNASAGTLLSVPDLLAPAPAAVASGVLRPLTVSAAGDFAYAKVSTSDSESGLTLYDVTLARADGASCAPLASPRAERTVFFVSAGGGLVWLQPDEGGGATDTAWFADTATCKATPLASGIWITTELEGAGLALWAPARTSAQSTVTEGTLRFAPLPVGSSGATFADVQTRADQIFATLGPRQPRLVFSLHADLKDKKPTRGQDGLWLSAALASAP